MLVIGEKINGAIPSVAKAIQDKDEEAVRRLASAQTEAGADYLDVCAGTLPEVEYDTLTWLLDLVQSASDLPICIDSPDPEILLKILPLINRPGLINSVSGEGNKCDRIFPWLQQNPDWNVIALACDDSGIPGDVETKVGIAFAIIEKASGFGIAPERFFIDPLVLSLATANDSMLQFIESIRRIRDKYPSVRFTSGLSNISYGMPARKLVNRNFLTLALSAGMDSAIMDPLNKEMMETVLAAEALLGRDRHCRNYNKAYRAGKIG